MVFRETRRNLCFSPSRFRRTTQLSRPSLAFCLNLDYDLVRFPKNNQNVICFHALSMTQNVLQLPDTLSIILEFLDNDTKPLVACLRANKTWFTEGARILRTRYRERNLTLSTPRRILGIKHLPALATDSERLQLYANFLRSCDSPEI